MTCCEWHHNGGLFLINGGALDEAQHGVTYFCTVLDAIGPQLLATLNAKEIASQAWAMSPET